MTEESEAQEYGDEQDDIFEDSEANDDLETLHALKAKSRTMQRDADSVTDQMRDEVMEMLKLFGVPFIVAPMEAEAQCAILEELGIVDGVVSDDSDAFLFGANKVYKNIFDDKKYVEMYVADDIGKECGLERHDFIALAMLLGSDYTQGIKGVGIVNAMEILHAFPTPHASDSEGVLDGLKEFRAWLDTFDPLVGMKPRKTPSDAEEPDETNVSTARRDFEAKHRNARKKWVIDDKFPDRHVAQAYLTPEVCESQNIACEIDCFVI